MANDLVLRVAQENGFTNTAVELIRNSAAVGCSDEEVAQLLILSHRTGLDPLARQVYMIKRRVNQGGQWVEVATPQTSIDGYRLIADRTGKYAPGREPTYQYDTDGRLFSATAYVKKLVANTWHEVAATAIYDEYVQTKKDGNPTQMWQRMGHVMLAKCAEALVLRRAFPAELSGFYTADEMAQADDTPAVTVQTDSGSRSIKEDTGEIVEAEVRPAAPEPVAIHCDECRNAIGPVTWDDGSTWDIEHLTNYTRKAFRKALCSECLEKAQQEAERRRAATRKQKAEREVVLPAMDEVPF